MSARLFLYFYDGKLKASVLSLLTTVTQAHYLCRSRLPNRAPFCRS